MEQKLDLKHTENIVDYSIDIPEGFQAQVLGDKVKFVKRTEPDVAFYPLCSNTRWINEKISVTDYPYTYTMAKAEGTLCATKEECQKLCDLLTEATQKVISDWNKRKALC